MKTEKTHAQNQRRRRIENRSGLSKVNRTFGTPVGGELTPTEIAHRARRKVVRDAKRNKRVVIPKPLPPQ